ncbi:hypothetical protein P3S67_009777 [Capsicum chacoense]|uniref:uncharacterized protein LOC107874751 n=1 Tax=Capsicum annuum TaxID=4072 RepID=UPI0007BF10B8|nr:uncharacterized protein LOC107874751 [Capsicum annuum]KAF3620178.1 putative E3 ubiquitin-protein ligaseB-like [Capsicum annuum]KAF3663703.1 putative E3 ubiquitin-protein ligaseB-like [Capsicum annuum]
MATAAAGRGAQSMNFTYFKPILRKAYHRKSTSPDTISDTVKLKSEDQVKCNKSVMKNQDDSWWVPDDRTGIFYPKGQEKVIEDVPSAAGRDFGAVNWFSNHEDYL